MINVFCIRPKGLNIGNDVIFQGTLAFLQRSLGPQVNVISLPATSRYECHNKAGLTARTVHEINQYGHGVIVGGGNLYENGELDVTAAALEALEAPLALFSLGAGRIYNRGHELVLRTDAMPDSTILMLDRKAAYSLGRDESTTGRLRQMGCRKIHTGGCPTLFLDEVMDRIPVFYHVPEVLFSIRTPELMNIPLADQARVRSDILRTLEVLADHGFRDVKLLCHDHRDLAFAASFGALDYLYTDDAFTYLGWLRACKLSIGYRLHAALPCLSIGTHAISISYDERATSMMRTIGYADWDINMIETENVAASVADRLERLKRLDELTVLREQTAIRWRGLRDTMAKTFEAFAGDVVAMARRTGRHHSNTRKACTTSPSI